MCEIRFNMTDDELSARIDTYLANIYRLRNQLRNHPVLQFMDKAWFPKIRNRAFNQWNDILSRNVASFRNCTSVDDLIEMLWNIKDQSGIVGIGETTVHMTAEILATRLERDMNANCWSIACNFMTSFCDRNNITREALVERVTAADDRLIEMTLMDRIIFVNSLLRSNLLEIIR